MAENMVRLEGKRLEAFLSTLLEKSLPRNVFAVAGVKCLGEVRLLEADGAPINPDRLEIAMSGNFTVVLMPHYHILRVLVTVVKTRGVPFLYWRMFGADEEGLSDDGLLLFQLDLPEAAYREIMGLS